MNYRYNNIDLNTFSFVAGEQQGSDIALSGFLDLPARTGKTFHNWGDEDGVEPYVASSDIAFGGRDLSLVGFIQGAGRYDCLSRFDAFQEFIKGQTGLIEFSSDWGIFHVQVVSISPSFLVDTLLEVAIKMHEPVVDVSAVIPVADSGDDAVDGISLKSLRAFVLSAGQSWLTEMKANSFRLPSLAEAPTFEMELFFGAESFRELSSNIKSFRALVASEGTRLLTIKGDRPREFFVTEGIRVASINALGNSASATVRMKAIELEFGAGYSFYVESDTMHLISERPVNPEYSFELDENRHLIMIKI